jgi:predicted enzyme related to lactoylglutathione lyase
MFNWEIGEGPIMAIPQGLGGPEPGPGGHIRQGTKSRVNLYFQVRDLTASLARTEELGGKVVSQPFSAPTGATMAFIRDPEGNGLALVQQ